MICAAPLLTLKIVSLRQYKLAGIGVGTPGPLELPAGRLHNPPNLTGWDGFDLRCEFEKRLKQSVFVETDANLAALAECLLGRGLTMGIDSLCMLTLGTGVGNGIIFNGKIFDGAAGMAGEAGHATIYPDGPTMPLWKQRLPGDVCFGDSGSADGKSADCGRNGSGARPGTRMVGAHTRGSRF